MTTNFSPSATDGKLLPVIAEYLSHDWSARVLHRVEVTREWELHWTDGINVWLEDYDQPWHALARLAALIAAVEQDVFLVHDLQDGNPVAYDAFTDEVDRFVSRTVHTSSCRPGCDGTDPVNHQV